MNKLFISPSPHIHSGDSIERNMYLVLLALVPALLTSFFFFGLGAVLILLVSIVVCCATEWLVARYLLGQTPTLLDGSALITAVLLAMNLPSNLPLWIVAIGGVVAIGVGKMSFGGLGGNIFNPALVGRVFLLIAYPAQMTTWPVGGELLKYADATTGATPLSLAKRIVGGDTTVALSDLPGSVDMLLGVRGGSLGEIGALALLLGLALLLYKRVITWHIPISILATVFVFSGVMHCAHPELYPSPFFHLTAGGMLLGAIFMATDYVTSPMTPRGQIVYGCMIGVLTVLIRLYGSYPEGMSFAILIMNAFTPLINTYIRPRHFGDK